MTTKPLVIYHQDCQDGYAAVFAAWLKFRDEAEYLPMQYNGSDMLWNTPILGREVYILDFSFTRSVMETIFCGASRVVWLDHHKSAFEMWCPYPYEKGLRYTPISNESGTHHIVLDDNKSGCILSWEYFHPGTEPPLLFRHIDDRDRWQWKMEGSAEINAALRSYQPWSFDQWEELVLAEHYGSLFTEGSAILRAQRQHIEQMLKQARVCKVMIHNEDESLGAWSRGLACNSQLHASELGHELANASGTFGLVWYLSGDNRVKCSFRSNGDYDVSAIAKAFGGGGHRNAAGCEVSIETLLEWLK